MKNQIREKCKLILLLAAFFVPLSVALEVSAHGSSYNYWKQNGFTRVQYVYKHKHSCCSKKGYWVKHRVPVVVAACTTSVTLQPLPTYVCCKGVDNSGRWRNNWVSGSCKAAGYATFSRGCTIDSPVYGTGAPILQRGQCQFSNTMLSWR